MIDSIESYRSYPAIHYSLLSALSKSPESVLSEEKDFSDAMMFGDVLDILMTQRMGTFEEKYIVSDIPKPTGQLGDFIDQIFKLAIIFDKPLNMEGLFDDQVITQAYEIVGFKRDKLTKVIERTLTEGQDYINFLIESQGKYVISQEVYDKAKNCENTLRNHKFTSKYWLKEGDKWDENIDVFYQLPITFDIRYGIEGKALLDIVIIDHNKKTIQPIDLKTTGDYWQSFPANFIKWNYQLQASFYSYGLSQCYKGYDILPFKFMVISSQQTNKPIMFKCTSSDLLVGEYGGKNKLTNKKVKGWRQLVEDYLWHQSTNQWEFPREVYEAGGELEIDVLEYESKEKVSGRKQDKKE